jgi:type I restriction enzyme S subunit
MSNQVSIVDAQQRFKKTPAGVIPVDWAFAKLGDIATQSEKRFDPNVAENRPYIGLEHMGSGNGRLASVGDSRTVSSLKTIFQKGDILFGKLRPNLRKIIIAPFDGVCSTDIIAIRPLEDVCREFLFYRLQSSEAFAFAVGTAAGTKMPRTSWPLLRGYLFPQPSLQEQKKIAEILSAVDESIEKTRAVIEKSQSLKKSLMQTLLTRGIGHKKFKKTPVGEIPVEWNARDIGSLTRTMINGGTPDTKVEKYWSGDIPWITGADFTNQKMAAVRRYITKEAVQNSSTNVVPKGAILIVTRTGVGKLAVADRDIAVSQDITGIIPDLNLILPEFLFWELNLFAPQLKATHQGTSINGILRSDLERFIVPVPPLNEQKKIVEILSAVDVKIEKEEIACKMMQGLKKSLMQGLLTGKVRAVKNYQQ